MDFTGHAALVTGASKGIGLAIAHALVTRGASVVMTARNAEELEAAVGGLNALGQGKAVGVAGDARDYASLERAVAAAVEHFGGLNTLVANAGVGIFKPVHELTLEEWHAVIDTNLTGVFYSVKAAAKELEKRQGYVFTISSLAGKNPFKLGAAYNASKFGLNGFSEAAMLDLRALGIKVTQIMPGSVATYFNDHTPSEADAWKIQPEDIAQIVVDLLEMPARTLPSRVEVRPSQPKSS
jgi:NAD(P)-dependent dehydrogenase (short-subunit alcohol dehydrogenase family)